MAFQLENFDIEMTFRCTELLIKGGNLKSRTNSFAMMMDIADVAFNSIPIADHNSNQLIGVISEHKSAEMVGILMGIMKSGNAFTIFDGTAPFDFMERQFERFCVVGAFCLSTHMKDLDFQQQYKITKAKDFWYFSRLPRKGKNNNHQIFDTRILYAIPTSGSTGEPKIVHVPFDAIMPNVMDFAQRFSLNEASSVLYSTTVNFDPSMVELLVAMYAGAELIIPPANWVESDAEKTIRHQPISFFQITPAALKCLSSSVLQFLFCPESTVESLLIGGENFPLNLVRQYMNQSTKTRVYNVYGVTEVSCWATCFELTLDRIRKLQKGGLVPIGEPLLDTKVEVSGEGQLLIYGRKCFVDYVRQKGPTRTGDIAYSISNPNDDLTTKVEEMIVVKSRHKPNSQLPSIELENEVQALFPSIISAKMLFLGNCRFLFLDHIDGCSSIPTAEIRQKIPRVLWPTRIFWNICIKNRSLTSNGKIDENILIEFVQSKYKSATLLDFLYQNYGIKLNNKSASSSLRHLGIGSLEATEIAFLLTTNDNDNSNSSSTTNSFGEIMQFVLDERNTLDIFLDKFAHQADKFVYHGEIRNNKKMEAGENKGQDQPTFGSKFLVEPKWRVDLGKCIDATPINHDGIIYAASHSGILVGCSASTGDLSFKYVSGSKDRFEADCAVNDHFIAIGGFAGNLHLFDKNISSSVPLCIVKSAGEIRMAPVFDGAEAVFWGDYAGNVWRLEIASGKSTLLAAPNAGPLRSSPLLFESSLIFGTLDGFIFSLDKINGQIYWKEQLKSPIFASPILHGTGNCFALTVKGSLNSLRISDGERIDSLQLGLHDPLGSFFDSPTIVDNEFLLIAAGKGQLFLLRHAPTLTFLRQILVPDPSLAIVRGPVIIGKRAFVLNTKGGFYSFSLANLQATSAVNLILQLDAETFGHPLVLREREDGQGKEEEKEEKCTFTVAIGTRQNWLQCFRVTTTSKDDHWAH